MTRIQLTATALSRLRPRLDAMKHPFEYVVMDETGTLRLNGREVAPETAAPECGLLSNDLFFSPFQIAYVEALVRSPALKWVQSCGAGLDHPMFVRLGARRDIRLTTNHSQGVGMAEYVMWGVLNYFHSGAATAVPHAKGDPRHWARRCAREIDRTHWLIIGFGSIGREVARRAKAFGAHVTGVRRTPEPSDLADRIVAADKVLGVLSQADVVVLCMPHTPATENFVDAKFLAAMKPESILVNVGRGSAIDDEALLKSLDNGRPGHALLDVFRVEPLPDNHPFWSHPNITATAHTSAVTTGWDTRFDELVIDNIGRYLTGQSLRNLVDGLP